MSSPVRRPRLAFSWSGLPQYAAWLLREAIREHGAPCAVVGTAPNVPVRGMERVLGQKIHWVKKHVSATWQELGEPVPEIFLQSGWATPAFNALGRQVREAGGAVILCADFCWRGDFRQSVIGPVAYRALHRRAFQAVMVAGRSGMRVARHFGVPAARIRPGMLGAAPSIFGGGPPLAQRSPEILFVGRMVPIKGVSELVEAFGRVAPAHPAARLRLCGSGPLADGLGRHPRVEIEPFVQPEDLAGRYRNARIFALPSRIEPWGLVVHEAALSGCALALSDAVGSGDDLAGRDNALRFPAGDVTALAGVLDRMLAWEAERLAQAEAESRRLARDFGPQRFARELLDLVELVRPDRRS